MPSYKVIRGLAHRVREKQDARDRDAGLIASGEMTEAQVAKKNDFFADLDLKTFRISAIGGKPMSEIR